MTIIVLSSSEGIVQKLESFAPGFHFIIAKNIINLHNAIVKFDFDGIFLDCNIRSVWTMNVAKHLEKFDQKCSCFYFNPGSLNESSIELYNIQSLIKNEVTLATPKSLYHLLQGEHKEERLIPFMNNKLNVHQKKLFHFFCIHEGKLVSVKDMSEHVFGTYNDQHKKTVYAYIHTIRTYIEDNPKTPTHLIRKEKGLYTYI